MMTKKVRSVVPCVPHDVMLLSFILVRTARTMKFNSERLCGALRVSYFDFCKDITAPAVIMEMRTSTTGVGYFMKRFIVDFLRIGRK